MASAAASSNYTASAAAASSKYAPTTYYDNNTGPKFSDYRSRVCQLYLKNNKKTISNLGYAR
jgi:hypothetical protein